MPINKGEKVFVLARNMNASGTNKKVHSFSSAEKRLAFQCLVKNDFGSCTGEYILGEKMPADLLSFINS